ncbi:gas vesicle accessory protein GvpU [Paenibacillus illinoisensis]|uniref:gas vesicle accessory protein GvpU n=1 Tax=Paenibacillus illinoisensis TaxID=59845 RepID=UPI003CF68424
MEEAKETQIKPPLDKDFTLQTLVSIANLGVSVSVTLNVGGTLVTGLLASGKEYMESAAKLFEGTNKQGEQLSSIYQRYADEIYSNYTPEDANIEFIHLKEATIFHGATDFNVNLWRGKINAVDGFSFGRMNIQ